MIKLDEHLTEQQQVRRDKLKELEQLGVDPFGSRFDRTHTSKMIFDEYDAFDHDTLLEMEHEVTIAGRIMRKRIQGKAGFLTLQDVDGQIQVYVRKDMIGDVAYEVFKLADLGDIIGISGLVFRTKTNELTIKAKVYTHLSKALRPLPDK